MKESERAVQWAEKEVGQTFPEPGTTDQCLWLLRCSGYLATRRHLQSAFESGMPKPERVPNDGKQGTRFSWNRKNMLDYAEWLEQNGKWLYCPLHADKMSPQQQMQSLRHHHAERGLLESLRQRDVKELVEFMTSCNDKAQREQLGQIIAEKVEA